MGFPPMVFVHLEFGVWSMKAKGYTIRYYRVEGYTIRYYRVEGVEKMLGKKVCSRFS